MRNSPGKWKTVSLDHHTRMASVKFWKTERFYEKNTEFSEYSLGRYWSNRDIFITKESRIGCLVTENRPISSVVNISAKVLNKSRLKKKKKKTDRFWDLKGWIKF